MPVEAPRPARHLEVERKFDVIESTVSPSFEGIAAGVRAEQSPATQPHGGYFDTPSPHLPRHP
ncbi:CHAD domain-containing protein, partial [Mycobacterium tuberculosis]